METTGHEASPPGQALQETPECGAAPGAEGDFEPGSAGALEAGAALEMERSCSVCGSRELLLVASSAEIAAQKRLLPRFHRARLKRVERDSLEERAEFTQDEISPVAACRRCGLLLRLLHPPREVVTKTYEEDSYGEETLRALFDSQLELFRPKARELARRLGITREPDTRLRTDEPRVLEIGSFVGGFLAAARELGWEATGIDPGREVFEFCRARGLRVRRESINESELAPQSLDAVAIWNTFDQLPDPAPTLRSLSRALREDGLLVVRVPNGEAFAACMRLLRRRSLPLRRALLAAMAWNNLLSFPYLHGYSAGNLTLLLEPYGFEPVELRGDVLTRLSDESTRSWARAEEKLLKLAWKGAARLAPSRVAPPWLDVWFRRRGPGLSSRPGPRNDRPERTAMPASTTAG